jgi:PIN domain nuclease of toxin-antitoxin system
MIQAVANTHAIIWYVYNDPRMSRTAGDFMDAADASGDEIGVSSISLVEIVYLIEKRRIDKMALDRVLALMNQKRLLIEIVVDRAVATSVSKVPRVQVPDMPDRIIAATAVHLGVPLISRDRKIQASSVQTIW